MRKEDVDRIITNMIECGTCGYPLTPEERTTLVEHNGRMVLPFEQEPVAWMWKDGTVTADPDRADGTWTPLYTAPQPAQQPPKFPTMLRKMWSGGEVQQWINENWNAAVRMRRATRDEKISNPGVYWVEDKE